MTWIQSLAQGTYVVGATIKKIKERKRRKTKEMKITLERSLEDGTRLRFFFFLVFLGPQPWHLEVPRLGVEAELQLPAYTTATATTGSQPHLQPTTQLTATPDP